jgi:transcriptional regulator with XRE-family HTH domain
MTSLGNYVANRRKALGLRQSDLAEALGYSVQAISKFENGNSEMDLTSLPKLAAFLSLSLNDLFSEAMTPKGPVCSLRFDGEILANNLAYLRNQKGLSQAELAETLGVSKRSIANYESGHTLPSPDLIQKFLQDFAVDADRLFGEEMLAPLPLTSSRKVPRLAWILSLILVGVTAIATAIIVPLSLRQRSSSNPSIGEVTSSSMSSSASSSVSSDATSTTSYSLSATSNAFPGLSAYGLRHNGKSSEILTPGSYTLSLESDPLNYFKDNEVSLAYDYSPKTAGVSLTLPSSSDPYGDVTLVIPDSITQGTSITVTANLIASGSLLSPTFTATLNNPTGDLDSTNFPGLKALYLSYNGASSCNLAPGHYVADVNLIGDNLSYIQEPDYVMGYLGQIAPGIGNGWGVITPFKSVYFDIPNTIADGFSFKLTFGIKKVSNQVALSGNPTMVVTVSNPGVS